MLTSRWRRRLRRAAVVAIILAILGAASVPLCSPVLAAYACPGCYGLERATPSLLVEATMSDEDRTNLQDVIASARSRVEAFYGSFDQRPTILACASEACDRRLGGKGARATTYGMSLIRLSPRGLNPTIIAHELSHAELHARIGIWRQLAGAIPAWFDEGLATVVADDERYLKPGATSAERCLQDPGGSLPTDAFAWGPAAGRTPGLYAQAACGVMRWMEENGGRSGLLAAIAQVADGTRRLP